MNTRRETRDDLSPGASDHPGSPFRGCGANGRLWRVSRPRHCFLVFGRRWLADLSNPFWLAFLVVWLFAVILLSAFAMERHGESLAMKLGEPRGTLIMTLAATGIEVMLISAFMFNRHEDSSPFARDALFAVVMIVLNGLVGISLLLGGLRYHEQAYNLQGANTFLAVIAPCRCSAWSCRTSPSSASGPTFSARSSHLSHRDVGRALWRVPRRPDLKSPALFRRTRRSGGSHGEGGLGHGNDGSGRSLITPRCCCYTCCPWSFSPSSSRSRSTMPSVCCTRRALGGLLVAAIVLFPESFGATRAALANHLQRSVNILLGLVLADISMTIPAVLIDRLYHGPERHPRPRRGRHDPAAVDAGAEHADIREHRTNMLHGAVHLLLFLAYLMLMFER